MERLKKQAYQTLHANNYYWRTYQKEKVDWVEEREGILYGYEIKWKPQKIKPPKSWKEAYSNASYQIIHQDNYLDFIT